jgi:hypothetical protein
MSTSNSKPTWAQKRATAAAQKIANDDDAADELTDSFNADESLEMSTSNLRLTKSPFTKRNQFSKSSPGGMTLMHLDLDDSSPNGMDANHDVLDTSSSSKVAATPEVEQPPVAFQRTARRSTMPPTPTHAVAVPSGLDVNEPLSAEDERKLFMSGVSDESNCPYEDQLKVAVMRERVRVRREQEKKLGSVNMGGSSLKDRMKAFEN